MKLSEIKTLIPEALNTTANIEWSQNGKVFEASFDLDDRTYEIFIEHYDFGEFDISDIQNVFEVSFTGKDKDSDNKATYKATGFNNKRGHNLKVFSIVKNSVEAKLKTLNYDIIFFDAKRSGADDHYESRASLYQTLTGLLKKQLNLTSFSKEYPNFYLFILSSEHPIEEDVVDAIVSLVARG